MNILVIDAQGGGLGRQIISALRKSNLTADIIAVGTNSVATTAMLKAGASKAATGENPIIVNAKKADIIIGPAGIVIANALLGEITPKMAKAIGTSSATRILIPFNDCDNIFVGVEMTNLSSLINQAIDKVNELIN